MRAGFSIHTMTRGFWLLGTLVVLAGAAQAQETIPAGQNPNAITGLSSDWLKSADDQQRQAATGEAFHATTGQDVGDPFAVLSNDSLWQEKYVAIYTRQLAETLSLSCETNKVVLSDNLVDLSTGQKVGFHFQPMPELTLGGDLHDSSSDAPLPSESTVTSGAAFSAETHLPLNAVVTLGLHADRTNADAPSGLNSQTQAYDAQWQQPLGQLPVSAVLKGHFETTTQAGEPASNLPSLEQSLVWKPVEDTTLQVGLRQQQYQEYPGVDHQLNEALFADWSQKIVDDLSWHSYAEVLNSRGLLDDAPGAPIASGANGTPQATVPGSNASPTSSLPVSINDQTLTFSTGPSFRLQKDISASLEYSDRWDKNPAPGNAGDEQRVSLSLKGTF